MKGFIKKTAVSVFFALILGSPLAAAPKQDAAQTGVKTVKVNVGIHNNGGGATAVAVAIAKGYFAEYGIDPNVVIVESGPVEMAAMRADTPTLDIGYIGPGVAWNPIDSSGNSLSFVFFGQLGNSERLLAKKGLFTDTNGNGTYDSGELYAGLRGKTVYFEVGTTPGGWFKNLISAINSERPVSDQLWLQCEDAAYLAGYQAPNNNPANRVLVVNYQNANIGVGMISAAGNQAVEIAVAFEPIPSTVLKAGSNIEVAADINALPKDKVFPSTFVANTKWLAANPETAQNFINALYRASVWIADNRDEALRIAEKLCQRPEGTFIVDSYAPTADDYRQWFAAADSKGYGYMRSLYDERLPNVPQGVTPKTLEQALDFSFLLKAIAGN
ncbi:bicyclomycin resistance protein [Spirochaetia bacterium]|nr:bicyclomycin resistance protein [Spirochaetia bacterium]